MKVVPHIGTLGIGSRNTESKKLSMLAAFNKMKMKSIMYVALSYDHRIIDGRESVGFSVAVKEALENPVELLMDSNPKKALEM
ncbi:2-oxo acid dehydrogenase subunit E2 [Tenacibaculum sp.]